MSKPIPYRYRRNEAAGRSISIYSVLPFGTAEDWPVIEKGWTVSHPDGTSGIGRQPFATEAEAQAWCDAHPNFPGMSQG